MTNDLRQWMRLIERSSVPLPSTNSLGRSIAPTAEGLTAFWNWFGGSKVVFKGNPLVVFHGTLADFRAFDPAKSNSNTKTGVPAGTFVFTNSHDLALSYAGQQTKDWGFATEKEQQYYHKMLIDDNNVEGAMAFFRQHAIQDVKSYKDGGNVMPCYLKMLKPLQVNARGENWRQVYFEDDDWTTNELMDHAKAKGYDGLIVRNVHDRQEGSGKAGDIYAVFSPTQIKSAIGNAGTFYPANDMIDEEDTDTAL